MTMTSIGDLATGLVLKNRSVQLKRTIETLTGELSSGRVSNITERVGADYSYLSDIDHNLARLDVFQSSAGEAEALAAAMQVNVGRIHDIASNLESTVIVTGQSNLPSARPHIRQAALSALGDVVSSLNGSLAGRALFAGKSTDASPLSTPDTLMAALNSAVSGLTDPNDIETAVDAWFSDPAGFDSVMYAGSINSLDPLPVGSGQHVDLTLRADDPSFRITLRNIALAAIATDPALTLPDATADQLLATTTQGLIASQDGLAGKQADLGFAQARIEEASARNATARTSLEYARGQLLGADPYETATRLEQAQYHLESLYAVTVRNANLSLLNFLK